MKLNKIVDINNEQKSNINPNRNKNQVIVKKNITPNINPNKKKNLYLI